MKNKKGFTLIELLAVILILGIIALIAIPTVNNILEESRQGAFSSTLNNLLRAIEEKCTLEQIKNTPITTSYTITNGKITPSLDIKGDIPDGTITVNANCEVAFNVEDNNFIGSKELDKEIIVFNKKNIRFQYNTYKLLTEHYILITPETNGTIKTAYTANTSIASVTVENKKIKVVGLEPGETEIYVMLTNGNSTKTTIKVLANTDNKDISFQNNSYKINVGEKKTLTLTSKEGVTISSFDISNNNISYKKTASNRSVIITGLQAGKTTLTVYTSDGKSATTEITVNN